jgi:hypothetical protein
MSFKFRRAEVAEFAGQQVRVARADTLYRNWESSTGEKYIRQAVVYEHEGQLAADVIEIREHLELKEGDYFTLPK